MQFQLVFPILSIKFSWEVFSSGWITRTILAAFLILVILNNGCAVKTPDIDQSLRAKALEGNAQSQYEVGEQYSDAWYSSFSLFDNNQDLREEAAVWYEMAANQGHAEAQYKLSLFYFQKDREKSFYWTNSMMVLIIKSCCSSSNSVCIGNEITVSTNSLVTLNSSSL